MTDEKIGGTDWELREAEGAMVAAGSPALALAMRRHSEAVRNMMQGELIPPFERVIDGLLKREIGALRVEILNALAGVGTRLGKIEKEQKRQAVVIRAIEAEQARQGDLVDARPMQRLVEKQERLDWQDSIERRVTALEQYRLAERGGDGT